MAGSAWKRPEGLALPTVWSRFKGTRAMSDGRVPDFWVQCVRPEDDAVVLDLLKKHFLREEETSILLNVLQHPDTVAELREMWQDFLNQRVSLAAWSAWPDGNPQLVAVNVLYVKTKNDPKLEAKTAIAQKVMRCLGSLEKKVDMFERHNVSEYLSAMGLTTLPEFRGQALGLELFRARVPLCKALGLRLTSTIFTGIGSQKQSERAGFKTVAELRYKEYEDNGERIFASASCDTMQLKELVVPPHD